MASKYALGLIIYYKPLKQKFYARRYRRTDAVSAVANFEDEVEVTSDFDFEVEIEEPDTGDVDVDDSGWGGPYDPPLTLGLGREALFRNDIPSLTNWPLAPNAKSGRKMKISFSKTGKGTVTWSLDGGSEGKKVFRPPTPPTNDPYGVRITLNYAKGKAWLRFKGQNPWGGPHDIGHP